MEVLAPRERKQRLLALVPHLTPDEVRALRNRLSRIDLRTDILMRLPVELKLAVLVNLSARDIWPCLLVSKAWIELLTAEDILTALSNALFPGLCDYAISRGAAVQEVFFEAARAHFFRSTGKFRAVMRKELCLEDEAEFRLDPSLHPTPPESASGPADPYTHTLTTPPHERRHPGCFSVGRVLYADGRIAWQPRGIGMPDDSLIIVDNFKTHLRKVFKYPGPDSLLLRGGRLDLMCLGRRLVVATLGRTLYAWDLELNDWKSVQLPSLIVQTEVREHSVAAIWRDRVYVWKFGGSLLELDMTEAKAEGERIRGPLPPAIDQPVFFGGSVFFHPTLEDVIFFVVMIPGPSIRIPIVGVFEFEGARYRQHFTFDLSEVADIELMDYMNVRCARRSSYGLYTVFLAWGAKPGDGSTASSSRVPPTSPTDPPLISLNFNVFTKKFSLYRHDVPTPPEIPSRIGSRILTSHFWNDQCVVWHANSLTRRGTLETTLLLVLNEGERPEHSDGTLDAPFYNMSAPPRGSGIVTRQAVKLGEVMRQKGKAQQRLEGRGGKQLARKPFNTEGTISYALDPGDIMPTDSDSTAASDYARDRQRRSLDGDDDLLLYVNSEEYTVWFFR